MSDSTRDIVVIGGGPGGYATALRAAVRGLSVALVSDDAVGGTCLHRGCVPSKALLHVGAVRREYGRLRRLGGADDEWTVGTEVLHSLRDDVVSKLHRGLAGLLKARDIEVVEGRGRLLEPGTVEVSDGTRLVARHVVLATGSVPRTLPNLPIDGSSIITSDHAQRPDRLPSSVLVVGGGVVGVEFATFWNSLGIPVTLVEVLDRLLPLEDASSSAYLGRAFRRQGIDVRTSTAVANAKVGADSVVVELADGASLEVDQVLVATGRAPNTSACGAAELGLLDERGFVQVDSRCQTALNGVWAVGDVLPTLALAHAAFAEGFQVADTIAGIDAPPIVYEHIPRVTFSHPEVASVGLTQEEAEQRFGEVIVTTESLGGVARALIEGESGQVKVISRADGEVVGVHVVGPAATELIAEATMATAFGAYVDEVAEIVHAHPTLAEGMREAFLAAAGVPFHTHG